MRWKEKSVLVKKIEENNMKKHFFLSLMLVCLINLYAQSTKEERDTILQLMKRNNLKPSDLQFAKDWSSSTKFKLAIVKQILQDPLIYPFFADSVRSVLTTRSNDRILEYFSSLLADVEVLDRFNYPEIENINQVFQYVETVWNQTEKTFNSAFDDWDEKDWEKMRYFCYSIHSEPKDSLQYKTFYKENNITELEDLEMEEITEIIQKVDFNAIFSSAIQFQNGFTILDERIKNVTWEKKFEKMTRWGLFCLGSSRNDFYDKDYTFIYDPSGDDQYSGSIGTKSNSPFYWVIDAEGDDVYHNDSIAGLFSVFFGLGIHNDESGNDVYVGNDYTFSSLFGYQEHIDFDGKDTYRSGLHSLGASTFGISICSDFSGNDLYQTSEFGEGFGSTFGIGLLLDYSGNDTYSAGGRYLHAPLAPNDYRSLSQGFGYGMRPDFAGGIGILYDVEGNDHYNGGVYAQGVAYWYALGMLFDESGNDFYDAVYYPQGSGIHLAAGMLWDGSGEDHYYSKHGPGQGAGHDYAVGFLIDRGGNDCYSVEGGNGLGLTNSVGIFFDVWGNDQYLRNYESNYGYANAARDAGGIGLFIDAGGEDLYPLERTKNDTIWNFGTFGIGLDTLKIDTPEQVSYNEEIEITKIDSLAPIDEIFEIASEWGVGSSKERVKKASEILLNRDEEAADYIAKQQLGTKNGLTYRAIKNFAQKSTYFNIKLKNSLSHHDSLYVKNAISLLGDTADSTAIKLFVPFLQKKQYLKTILSALGNMKTDEALPFLLDYKDSNSEMLRVIVARGFKKINTRNSIDQMLSMKNDSSFLIKSMIFVFEENQKKSGGKK